MTETIQNAARWLATTPADRRPHPLVPYLRQTYGLSVAEAVKAIQEANMRLSRAA